MAACSHLLLLSLVFVCMYAVHCVLLVLYCFDSCSIYDFNWGKPKEFQPPGIHSHSSHTAPEGSTTRPPLNVDDSNSMI